MEIDIICWGRYIVIFKIFFEQNTHSLLGEIWIDLAAFLEISNYHKNKETREQSRVDWKLLL